MKTKTLLGIVIICLAFCQMVHAQSTELTYQGSLNNGGTPATGNYDFEFLLFDLSSGGSQIGSTLTRNTVAVSAGVFSVKLDFGSQFPGASRFLEIRVRQTGGGGFTTLAPRQAVSSTPYAVKSLNAATSDNTTQLGGVAANQYVLTGDTRLSDERNPSPNSSNYIQNTTNQQAASNFNINGNGTAGGTLSGNTVNAITQYNIGGSRVFSTAGTGNLFAGVNSGANNTGVSNSFFGSVAGVSNMTGNFNSFFGSAAGNSNMTGFSNSFFGAGVGLANTTGNFNSFFGRGSGGANTIGSSNSFFGFEAGLVNTASFNTMFGNQAGLGTTSGAANTFVGASSGLGNVDGANNSFFGVNTGVVNTSGSLNTFIGRRSGNQNTTGGSNTFIGNFAGSVNIVGSNNTVVGAAADVSTGNLTFATAVGSGTVVSNNNTIVLGRSAGQDAVQIPGAMTVTGALTANGSGLTNLNAGNIVTGTLAPARLANGVILNQTTEQTTTNFNISGTGTANIFNATTQFNIGGTRVFHTPGTNNTFAGQGAGITTPNFASTDHTFFGFNAGAATGISVGNSFFGSRAGQSTTIGENSFFGVEAGRNNVSGAANSFFGAYAGRVNTASNNSFFGLQSGGSNTSGTENSFFGAASGFSNVGGSRNTFVGRLAGQFNQAGNDGVYVGYQAGRDTVASFNTFIGTRAGRDNTSGTNNTVIGVDALRTNLGGINNTALGANAGFNNVTGSNNTLIGTNAGVGSSNLTFATAIGAGATVFLNSEIVLGRINDTVRVRGELDVDGHIETQDISLKNNLNSGGNAFVCLVFIPTVDLPPTRSDEYQFTRCGSSINLKFDVESHDRGMSTLQKLRPVFYKWKSDGSSSLGLIAEEVDKVDPLLAAREKDGTVFGVNFDAVTSVLIKSVQEQQLQIEAQEKLIAGQNEAMKTQQERLDKQQSEIDSLKAIVCEQNPTTTICLAQKAKP